MVIIHIIITLVLIIIVIIILSQSPRNVKAATLWMAAMGEMTLPASRNRKDRFLLPVPFKVKTFTRTPPRGPPRGGGRRR